MLETETSANGAGAAVEAVAAGREDRRAVGELGFVAGGHTAGEEMLIEQLVEAPARELTSRLSRVTTAQVGWNGIEVRLTGLIVFGPDPPLLPG